MINNVVLTGRITRDHDLRYTPNTNQAVLRFTLAVDRRFTNRQTGQRETDFISCTAFGKTAETLAQYTRKGSLIGVEGNIRTGRYENQQGQTVYTTDVIVENFTFLESSSASREQQSSAGNDFANMQSAPQASTPSSEKPNFAREESNVFGGDSPFDISDDDLPF